MGQICTVSNGHLQYLLPCWAGGQFAEDASPKAAQAGLIQVLQHHRDAQTGCTATDATGHISLQQRRADQQQSLLQQGVLAAGGVPLNALLWLTQTPETP